LLGGKRLNAQCFDQLIDDGVLDKMPDDLIYKEPLRNNMAMLFFYNGLNNNHADTTDGLLRRIISGCHLPARSISLVQLSDLVYFAKLTVFL